MNSQRMMAVLAAMVVLFGFGSLGKAQEAGGKGERAGKLKAALSQLDLSAEQKGKIKEIVEKYKAEKPSPTTGESGERKTQAKGMIKEIMEVLTPQQKRKLMKIMKAEKTAATEPAAN